MEKNEYQIMLRLTREDGLRIYDAAHARRSTVSAFVRELVLGRLANVAPPLVGDLPHESQELLKTCRAGVSNLSQLNDHAARGGEKLSRLSGPDGGLAQLTEKLRKIGISIKLGEFPNDIASQILTRIDAPARSLNELARALNSGELVLRQHWFDALTNLQAALDHDLNEVGK